MRHCDQTSTVRGLDSAPHQEDPTRRRAAAPTSPPSLAGRLAPACPTTTGSGGASQLLSTVSSTVTDKLRRLTLLLFPSRQEQPVDPLGPSASARRSSMTHLVSRLASPSSSSLSSSGAVHAWGNAGPTEFAGAHPLEARLPLIFILRLVVRPSPARHGRLRLVRPRQLRPRPRKMPNSTMPPRRRAKYRLAGATAALLLASAASAQSVDYDLSTNEVNRTSWQRQPYVSNGYIGQRIPAGASRAPLPPPHGGVSDELPAHLALARSQRASATAR